MAQPKLETWESYINKTFKMKKPGVHGEGARYRVDGVLEMDFGTNGGGTKTAFKVTRLDPEGTFTRECALFKKQFTLAVEEPEDEEEKAKDLSPSAIDKRLTKVEERILEKK